MSSLSIVLPIIVVFFFVAFYMSQLKLRNKLLCTFTRPNMTKVESWIPLYSQEVVFDDGKYGVGRYQVVPKCITMQWYTREMNRLFPTLVPTMDFVWWSDMPIDPKTGKPTWATPEARQAGRQEDNIKSLARQVAAAGNGGKKSRFPEWFFPAIVGVALILVTFFLYSQIKTIGTALNSVENQIKVLKP